MVVTVPVLYFAFVSPKTKQRIRKAEQEERDYDKDETRTALDELTRDIPVGKDEEIDSDSSISENNEGADDE